MGGDGFHGQGKIIQLKSNLSDNTNNIGKNREVESIKPVGCWGQCSGQFTSGKRAGRLGFESGESLMFSKDPSVFSQRKVEGF